MVEKSSQQQQFLVIKAPASYPPWLPDDERCLSILGLEKSWIFNFKTIAATADVISPAQVTASGFPPLSSNFCAYKHCNTDIDDIIIIHKGKNNQIQWKMTMLNMLHCLFVYLLIFFLCFAQCFPPKVDKWLTKCISRNRFC